MFDHLVQSKVYTSNTSFTTTSPSPGQYCTDSTFKTILASICLNFTVDHIRDSIPRPWSIWPLKISGCNQFWSRYDLITGGWHMSLTPVRRLTLSPPLWHCHHVTGPWGRTQETLILFKIHFGPELVWLCPFIAHQLLNYTSCPQL